MLDVETRTWTDIYSFDNPVSALCPVPGYHPQTFPYVVVMTVGSVAVVNTKNKTAKEFKHGALNYYDGFK